MKAAPTGYVRARSISHAIELLRSGKGEPRLLAGGQNLVASLNLRLIDDVNLIDINHLCELRGILLENGHIRIGALTRHCELATSPDIARHAPALAQAAPLIAHEAIRRRGTIGGSLAYADPAAELPACAVALGAQIVLSGPDGERRIAAEDFFQGLFETALGEDEIIVAVAFPVIAEGQCDVVLELARRSGDYALAGIAARVAEGKSAAPQARIAFFGVGDAPALATNAMAALADGKGVEAACEALSADLDPPDDMNGTPGQKLHLARVLLKRALAAAASPKQAA